MLLLLRLLNIFEMRAGSTSDISRHACAGIRESEFRRVFRRKIDRGQFRKSDQFIRGIKGLSLSILNSHVAKTLAV